MTNKRHMRIDEYKAMLFNPESLAADGHAYYGRGKHPKLVWRDDKHGIFLYQGDCLILLEQLQRLYPKGLFDLIFADPPYFLSNGGITCQAGKMVSVNKGDWDKLVSVDRMHEFNRLWLDACRNALRPNGTIFVSGTSHVIHSIGFAMQQLEFKLLNDITWIKPNPPPNLSCRYLTHASETILWAAKNRKSRHRFNYELMKRMAGGRQMKSTWYDIRWDEPDEQVILEIYPPAKQEKIFGKHPTQKPLMLLERIIMAASGENDIVFDPFMGSGTTGIAAKKLGRRFVGCELDPRYVRTAAKRLELQRKQGIIDVTY